MTSNSGRNSNFLSTIAVDSARWLWQRPVVMVAVFVLLVASIIWYDDSASKDSRKKAADDAALETTPVVVTAVRKDNLDIYLYGLGIVTPLNTVVVGSRVDGQLLTIAFKEGQIVEAGQLLAQVDPAPFEVEYQLAEGQLVRDQALLDQAKIDLERYHTLLEQDSISIQLVDTKESLVRQHQAAVKADQGAVTGAQLKLTYAQIIAPIGGRLGFAHVDAGNIVRASDKKGIVTITQLDPIGVIFPVPEDTLPLVMALLDSGDNIPVELYDRGMKNKLAEGRLLAIDNQIDVTTGTVKLKAGFSNTNGRLFANQFVNVKLTIKTLPDVTQLPTAAIRRGVMGTFVYVVQDDQTVTATPVTLLSSQSHISAIEDGIAAGAQVVIEGADQLRDGAKINIAAREPTVNPAVNPAINNSEGKQAQELKPPANDQP
jgi:multidrug efflux system membrane fusion protein